MRALILSDFHGQKEAFFKIVDESKKLRVELIVISGDITNFGQAEQAKALLSPLISLKLPILYVPGNCDLPSLLEAEIDGTKNIHGSCVKINNLMFIGVGGSPSGPLHTPLEFPEDEIMVLLNKGFAKCSLSERLILVSHTPPFNTKLDLAFFGEHIGSRSIRSFVDEKKPIAVLCGHVHEARGIDKLGETFILNPGPARYGNYAVVDINSKVKIRLGSFK